MNELQSLYYLILSELTIDPFFSYYKYRKRDSSFIRKTDYGKNIISLDHWEIDLYGLVIYPQYLIRYDVLRKWFEKFSFKSLQDQRDGYYVGYSGKMLDSQDKFVFLYDKSNLMDETNRLKESIKLNSKLVFDAYSSLEKAYDMEITPILLGSKLLPDVGADWFFENLTLGRIVHPETYEMLKEIHLKHAKRMYDRGEPNISSYYNRLSEILSYLENLEFKI